MNPRKNSLIIIAVMSVFALSACVTTRQQMNEEKGITDEPSSSSSQNNSVKSEDISKPAQPAPVQPPPVAEPSQQPGPVAQTPPVTAPVPTNAVSSTPAPMAGSSGSYTMDEIRSEMARLSGKVEELEHEKKTREEERAAEQKKLQEKIAELEKQLQEKQGPALPEGKTPFEAGKDAYFNEHFDEAIVFLDKAISTKETGKEAEEAYYIRGESKFKLKNYQAAIIDYSKFPEKFPKSSYHPKALLRIAESFDAMGLKDDAKAFYQNLVDQFPKTAEGKLAKKRLSAPSKKK